MFLCWFTVSLVLLQVLEPVANVLRDHGFRVEKRGEVFVKGKGNLTTYFVTGKGGK